MFPDWFRRLSYPVFDPARYKSVVSGVKSDSRPSREANGSDIRENYPQFQSALAMLDRMYDGLDLAVTYREMERART